jgi:hypothetical protein
MLVQGCGNRLPHGVKNKINAFPPGEFGGRHKISITRHQDDLVRLPFVRQCGNIQADSHVYAFLHDVIREVLIQ